MDLITEHNYKNYLGKCWLSAIITDPLISTHCLIDRVCVIVLNHCMCSFHTMEELCTECRPTVSFINAFKNQVF